MMISCISSITELNPLPFVIDLFTSFSYVSLLIYSSGSTFFLVTNTFLVSYIFSSQTEKEKRIQETTEAIYQVLQHRQVSA